MRLHLEFGQLVVELIRLFRHLLGDSGQPLTVLDHLAQFLAALFKHSALGDGWQRHKVVTVRWRLFHLPGKVVRHAGAWVLKISAEAVELFRSIREKSFKMSAAMPP